MSIKKVIFFFCIFIAMAYVLFILAVQFAFSDWNNFVEKKYEYTITTEYKDNFRIKETQTGDFPEPIYNVEIYDANQKSKPVMILKLDGVETEQKEIKPFYNCDEIKCYSICGNIMFQIKGRNTFSVLEMSNFADLDTNGNSYLIPIAKQFLLQDWYSAQDVSEFLLKSRDEESINIIKRYAKGDFTEEEMRHNIYSSYSKDDMEKFFTDLLIKYKMN